MLALLRFVLAVLASPFKSKSRLEAENAALRQQLIVLRRKLQGRFGSRTTIAGSLSSCIAGFRQFWRSSRSSPFRDARAVASRGLSLLLVLEVALTGRAAADRDGPPRVDPADERREPALGSAAHPR